MSIDRYPFRLGAFECLAISDGTYTYPNPSSFLFANAPAQQLERALREHGIEPEKWTQWTSPYICLLVNTGKRRVLVDTGADGLGPNTGKLLSNLQLEGITPGDIDTVILTHAHPDHIGGNISSEGKMAFPNARFAMRKDEWSFWMSNPDLGELKADEHVKELLRAFARNSLTPLQGRVDLIEGDNEILPGFRPTAAPGHTPGHMALTISSEGEQLLLISDTVIHPIHVEHPEWRAAVDISEQVVATRRRLLRWAATQKALVLAFHFPFPGLGHVVQKGNRWQWQPIRTSD